MTALKRYERLESLGLWKEPDVAQRREVFVSFGAASLVLSDVNGKPLSHWSLAAVRTHNPGKLPTIYSPDDSSGETLEIDDKQMIEAIQEVRKNIRAIGPHPGRLRWILSGAILCLFLVLVFFWLPSISADYATRVVPKAKAEQIGEDILTQTSRLTGQPCSDPLSLPALRKFEAWLLPDGGNIHVVDMGARYSSHIPNGNILLNRVLFEENAGPEIAAGFVLMERALARENDPMVGLFQSIGTRGTLTFIANGTLSHDALAFYARKTLTSSMTWPQDAPLLEFFKTARLTSSPYAYALDTKGKATAGLIAGDPVKQNYRPQITDADWIALQNICGDG